MLQQYAHCDDVQIFLLGNEADPGALPDSGRHIEVSLLYVHCVSMYTIRVHMADASDLDRFVVRLLGIKNHQWDIRFNSGLETGFGWSMYHAFRPGARHARTHTTHIGTTHTTHTPEVTDRDRRYKTDPQTANTNEPRSLPY